MNATKQLKGEPVFPWLGLSFLSLGMLAHSIVFTSPLPYVAFMVVDFNMTNNLDKAGYTAGYITGAFMLGRTVAATFWGMGADRFGRRICLVSSMINVCILGIVFGFSSSFAMAVTLRFAIGLGNGFMGICKTVVTELVESKEHEMRAFGLINGVWGMGLIVGPAIGGLLSRPVIQYPDIFDKGTIWDRFPYLMPSLVCAAIAMIAAVGVAMYVPETLQKASPTKYESVLNDESAHSKTATATDIGEDELDLSSFGWSEKRWRLSQSNTLQVKSGDIEMQQQQSLVLASIVSEDQDEHTTHSSTPTSIDNESNTNGNASSLDATECDVIDPAVELQEKLPSTFKEILKSSNIQFLFFVYMAYCFLIMYVDETFPLWCVTSLANGGLGWEAAEVGETLASIGFGLVIYQLFIYEWMMKRFFRFGSVEVFFRMLIWSANFMILLPIIADLTLRALIASNGGASIQTRYNVPLRIVIVVTWLAYRLPATSAFTTLAIVVNGSVDSSMRGTINGLIMTAGSLGNAGGPMVGSVLYALFLSMAYAGQGDDHKPNWLPIDGRAVFVTAGLMAIGLAFFVRTYMKVKGEN